MVNSSALIWKPPARLSPKLGHRINSSGNWRTSSHTFLGCCSSWLLINNFKISIFFRDCSVIVIKASNKSFDVIGVSEIWYSENSPIVTNIDILGYKLYSTKLLSQNGRVGLYFKYSINSINRVDLNYQYHDLQTIGIETEAIYEMNLFFAVFTDILTLQ